MPFIPPQVLNKSLLNSSLNSSFSSPIKTTTNKLLDTPISEPIDGPLIEPLNNSAKGSHDIPPQEKLDNQTSTISSDWFNDNLQLPVNHESEKKVEEFIFEESDSENEAEDAVYQDMQLFFHAIDEPQLIELFLTNKVTLGQLLSFDEQDLINCGVHLVGDRKKILANTGQMHCEKWSPSSLHDLSEKSLLSSPGIYSAINDINKHIDYIGSTLLYLKGRIIKNPEILELGKDFVGVGKVSSELEDLTKTMDMTRKQATALKHRIDKYLPNPHFEPANHVDNRYVTRAKLKQKLILAPFLVVFATVLISLKLTRRFSVCW